jgi:hypothetical protein
MTTKQIAEATGKAGKTVRTWISILAADSATIAAKLAASSPMKPAEYDMRETCQIIEEGMGKAAADVYRTNAANAEVTKVTRNATNGKLPAGVQIRAMMNLYGSEEARKRIDFVLGYKTQSAPKPEQLALPASRLSKAAYAVEQKERQKALDKAWQDLHNGKLF